MATPTTPTNTGARRSGRDRIPSYKILENSRQPPSSSSSAPTTSTPAPTPSRPALSDSAASKKKSEKKRPMTDKRPGGPAKRPHLKMSKRDADERESSYAANGMFMPSFAADAFLIYKFAPPAIRNFPDIDDSRRAEKKRLDEEDAAGDFDDGGDDWEYFAIAPADDEEYGEGFMARNIASVFRNRAKRAYRAKKTWATFEDEELAIKTQAAARAEPDPARREMLLEEALCETSRLQVFDRIKKRLCNEIFLEHYDERRFARKDSMMPSQSSSEQHIPEEEKTVARWQTQPKLLDPFGPRPSGVRQQHAEQSRRCVPVYKGSEPAPIRWEKTCSNCGEFRPDPPDDSPCTQCKTMPGIWHE